MWPLLLCSIISVTIIIERFVLWIFKGFRSDSRKIENIFDCVEEGRCDEATSIATNSKDYVLRVLAAGLEHRNSGIIEAMETTAMDEIEKMKRGLRILDTIITMAPTQLRFAPLELALGAAPFRHFLRMPINIIVRMAMRCFAAL